MSPRHFRQAAGLPRAALRPSVRAVRHGLLAMLLSAAPFAITPLQAADSAAVSRSYSVAPGSLATALASFAEQAGVSVAVSPDLAAGKRSAGLQGQWPVAEGLQRLLEGSGLEAAPSGEGVYVIRPLPGAGAVELGTTSIIGREQSATGPVDGYLAERSAAGTKTDTPLIKTPQSVSVVTRDQMDDQAVTSVAQALRYSGGTFADYRGSSHRVDEVYVRGFGYAPTYLDGLTVGGESYTQVDPWFLERVELIHGPASVLYGQANPGGLLAMTSKRPSTEAKNRVQFGVGSDSLRRGAFDLNGQLDEQGTLLYRLNGLLSKGQAEVDHIDEERQALAPSLTWQPNEDTSLTLLAYYQNDPDAGYRNFWPTDGVANSGPHGRISRHLNVGDPDFYQSEREQSSIGYLFEHRFNELLTFRQNLRYLKENERFKQLVFMSMVDDRTMRRVPADSRAELEQVVVDNQLQFDFATGPLSHTLLTGVDYKRSHRDATDARDYNGTYLLDAYDPQYGADVGPLTPSSDTTQRADQVGFYLQDQIEYGNWNLLLGGRQDRARTRTDDNLADSRESLNDEQFTGRAGLLYAFDSGFSPYISYSTSFEPVLSTPEPGQSAFEPTTGEQTEIGLKYQPPGTEAMFSVALFDLTQENVVTYDGGWYPTQTGEIRTKGIELEARGNLTDNLELVGAFTHLEPEVTKTTRPGVEGKEPPRTPAHLASLWATYQFDGSLVPGLSAGAGVRYVGSSFGDQYNESEYKVDSVVLLDAMLGYDLSKLDANLDGASVQLNASNLTDKVYAASCAAVDTCFYGASRTVTASVNYAW